MLRSGTRRLSVAKLLVPSVKKQSQRVRLLSSSSTKGSSGGKVVLTILGAGTLAAGGTVAYAKYDPEFRKTVEETVPYSDAAFEYLLGSPEPIPERPKPKPTPMPSPTDVKQKAKEESLMKKKMERTEPAKPAVAPPAPTPPKPVQSPAEKEAEERTMQAKAAEERARQQEAQFAARNQAVSRSIEDAKDQLERLAMGAITAQRAAIASVRKHTDNLYKALDESQDSADKAWDEVRSAQKEKDAAIRTATEKLNEAKAAIERLKSLVRDARSDKVTSSNPSLQAAEQAIERELYRLQKEESEMASAQSECQAAKIYDEKLGAATRIFQEELHSLVPDMKIGEQGEKLSEEQMRVVIKHAIRKVERLQKELAKQQATEQQRLEKLIELQKHEDGKVADTRVAMELAKQQRDLEEEFQKKLRAAADEFEQELRHQLRRQTAAHSDHIQEVLHVQRQELDRRHAMDLEERLLEDRGKYQAQLAASLAKLKGLEDALRVREEVDAADRKAKQLWLACQDLKRSLKTGGLDPTGDAHLVPLSQPVTALKGVARDDDVFVSTIVSSIPEEALRRGVYSEHALKCRFRRVDEVCRKVAMIGDEGGSLARYLLSYLQSFLVVDKKGSAGIPEQELNGEVRVDPLAWDTFDILRRVNYCLEHENLEQALRYANQLRGEPRNVARDWIEEARALLEVKQAVDALMAHAASVSVQAFH